MYIYVHVIMKTICPVGYHRSDNSYHTLDYMIS